VQDAWIAACRNWEGIGNRVHSKAWQQYLRSGARVQLLVAAWEVRTLLIQALKHEVKSVAGCASVSSSALLPCMHVDCGCF
jgi:hypothetical protein